MGTGATTGYGTPPADDDAPVVPPEIPLDPDGRVDAEIHCRNCGYIIKALRPEDSCPECGEAVIDSLRGGVLRFASRWWLEAIDCGCC